MSDPKSRTRDIPKGGTITYRLPNVLEVLRFQSACEWFSEKHETGQLRVISGIESLARGDYPLVIESPHYKTVEQMIQDQENTDVLVEIVLDIIRKKVTEEEKKP